MKHLKLSSAIIFSAVLLFACNGTPSAQNKTSTSEAKKNSSPTVTQSDDANLSGTDGRFSYTIDGRRLEAINYVQHANLFINEVTNYPTNGMIEIEVTCESNNIFDFIVSNKGTTTFTNFQLTSFNIDKKNKEATYMDGKTYKNLYPVSLTETINSIDGNRVTGNFSGTFKAHKEDGGATANITDGSFNLPFGKN